MATAAESVRTRFFTPPFALAVALLTTAAILAGPVGRWLNFKQEKLALPLRKAFSAMDEQALSPYRIVDRRTLEPAVVEALGTDQFVHWVLEDTSVSPTHPLRYATLFVTYHTGGRDLVPHTPDECMLGAGYHPSQPHENRRVAVPSLSEAGADLPVRVCTFGRTAIFNREEITVVYTFACNGRFAATRTGVRILINDPRNSYAYFSKVEVSFSGADRRRSVEGATKLLNCALPVLLRDHWPDFDAAERAARQDGA